MYTGYSYLSYIAAATIPFPTSYARAFTKVTYYLLTYSHGEVPNFWLDQKSFLYIVSPFSKILISKNAPNIKEQIVL